MRKKFCYIVLGILFIHRCVLSKKINKTLVNSKVIPLVKQWAPKVYLDPQEKFFPSSVDDFLKEVIPVRKNERTFFSSNGLNIPIGKNSNDYYFTTKKNRDALLKDGNSILYGVNPSKQVVSIYAHVKTCDANYNHFIVTYWFFYPFNQGKEMCTVFNKRPFSILKLFDTCTGKSRVYGNHIGDWERVSLEIKNGIPTFLFLSVHDVGVFYRYDHVANSFGISNAKSKGLGEVQDPPQTVRVNSDGHPVLFSAKGSHALWAGVGTHKYTKLKLRELSDAVDFGTQWDTWQSVEVFYSDETTPEWFKYRGRWGNPGSNCLANIFCEFSDGPPGLVTRQQDFHCPPTVRKSRVHV